MRKTKQIYISVFIMTLLSCHEPGTVKDENHAEGLKKDQTLPGPGNETMKITKPGDAWQTFHHPHGFTIQLPAYFSVGGMTSSGIQYYKTDRSDQIMIGVETFGGGHEELVNDYTMRQKTSAGVGYKLLKENWFVVSGQDDDGIYYFKEIAKDDRLHSLLLQYPAEHKRLMDSILPRISKSFQ